MVDTSGSFTGYRGTATDTPNTCNPKLQGRKQRLNIAYWSDHASDAIAVLQQSKIAYRNQVLLDVLHTPLAETTDRHFLDFIAPEDRDRMLLYYEGRLRGEDMPVQYEVTLFTQDEQRVVMEAKPCIVLYQGQPATLIIMRNITERKQAQEVLHHAKESA